MPGAMGMHVAQVGSFGKPCRCRYPVIAGCNLRWAY